MTSQRHSVQPPRVATWLVNLFAPAEEESIMGDLLEEYSHLVSISGVVFADSWYWRQVVKTIAHLASSSFRTAPFSTVAAVAGGFLLRRLVAGLPERAVFAILERYQVFDHHFGVYMFFASTGIDIGQVVVFLFIGYVVALAARGREMAATMTLSLIYGAMAVVAFVATLSRTGDYPILWRQIWCFADLSAILIGGAIVRTRRSAATTLPDA